ncbi:aspartate racemase [Bacillus sp. OxB-1]|uniref:aspartate/glutamate racemase family protein n=1 Tax=Bacillus sp. (strain OxB-1) TaxID=98228 RepID=UPI000581CC84|nr:aspartate racemase [Bacillus sp. OxB-1]
MPNFPYAIIFEVIAKKTITESLTATMQKKTLGIIGGVGPLATMYIGEMIVRRTAAEKDQDHVNMVITNNTNIPDRTAFILGESEDNPVPVLISDSRRLEAAGAQVLAIPCNTAHSFYSELQESTQLPIIDMVSETAMRAKELGADRVGILATSGTITTEVYQLACERNGLTPVIADPETQEIVMSVIYDDIKAGRPASREKWDLIEQAMKEADCDKVILGCTELSIVREELQLGKEYIDSLLVLADTAIERCGYEVKR